MWGFYEFFQWIKSFFVSKKKEVGVNDNRLHNDEGFEFHVNQDESSLISISRTLESCVSTIIMMNKFQILQIMLYPNSSNQQNNFEVEVIDNNSQFDNDFK